MSESHCMRSPTLIRVVVIALALGLLSATQAAQTTTIDKQATRSQLAAHPAIAYWLRNQEGWFWYRDPAPITPRSKSKPAASQREKTLADFVAMQERLEDLKRVAVMNPSNDNLTAYMRYQRWVMNKSARFAERWQRLVWSVPELDYGLTGRPTNAMAINTFDDQHRDQDADTVRGLAATHGLLFVFRSDCPFCHRFAPILKRFEQEFGMTVLAVSLDGAALPEYPHAQSDNGIAARLNPSAVPALYLTAPTTREIQPVGFGLMSLSELIERIATLARDRSPTTVSRSDAPQ
ncbi:MAG: conjugal transfer protein TraF [Gammaproteobacteria bacterium]|nr:conjugal transfer protein TraF [Gammaproteobacteria bacterium]